MMSETTERPTRLTSDRNLLPMDLITVSTRLAPRLDGEIWISHEKSREIIGQIVDRRKAIKAKFLTLSDLN